MEDSKATQSLQEEQQQLAQDKARITNVLDQISKSEGLDYEKKLALEKLWYVNSTDPSEIEQFNRDDVGVLDEDSGSVFRLHQHANKKSIADIYVDPVTGIKVDSKRPTSLLEMADLGIHLHHKFHLITDPKGFLWNFKYVNPAIATESPSGGPFKFLDAAPQFVQNMQSMFNGSGAFEKILGIKLPFPGFNVNSIVPFIGGGTTNLFSSSLMKSLSNVLPTNILGSFGGLMKANPLSNITNTLQQSLGSLGKIGIPGIGGGGIPLPSIPFNPLKIFGK